MKPSLPKTSHAGFYKEATVQPPSGSRDAIEEICPLFHTLKRVEVRYSPGEIIGQGGMKEVLRVYDEQTERHVALARPKQGTPIGRFDAFLREAHITARLEHPNIIKLFDMGIDDHERPFFTMEFKHGHSLRSILSDMRKGKLVEDYPKEKRLSVFLRVCEAIAYAHSRHVLHLDLKPENIQVGTFGEVQVCDWGMGEIQRGDSEQHHSEALLDPDLYGNQLEPAVKGTPGYMAPELSDPRATKSQQTDIYSLGCLLYELSTLRAPSSMEKSPPKSPAIAAIVSKACAKEPGDRYESAEAMGEEVARHLSGFSTHVEKAGLIRELRLFYRRNRIPCLISFYAVILLLCAALWFTNQLRHSYQRTTDALARTENALAAADEARKNAEDSLTRYEQEHDYANALIESRSDTPLESSLFLIDSLMIRESINLPVIENALLAIDKGLSQNPPKDDRLWTLKAHVLFLCQRFGEAEKYFAIRSGDQGVLQELAHRYSDKVGKNGLLPIDDFLELIENLSRDQRSRWPLIEKMAIYDSLKRNSPEITARIIETLLKSTNPRWKNPVFAYDAKKAHLTLSGSGLCSLYRRGARRDEKIVPVLSLLRLLKLESLDLRGSDISDLWNLEGTNLRSLDIRKTPVTDLDPLAEMRSLRELIVEPGQFDEPQLAVLRGQVVVREKALEGK